MSSIHDAAALDVGESDVNAIIVTLSRAGSVILSSRISRTKRIVARVVVASCRSDIVRSQQREHQPAEQHPEGEHANHRERQPRPDPSENTERDPEEAEDQERESPPVEPRRGRAGHIIELGHVVRVSDGQTLRSQ